MGFIFFVVSIPIVSYCKIIGLCFVFTNTYLRLFFYSLFHISPRRIVSVFHQRRYTGFMYHFFNQALHVGTDIGAGFLSQTGYCFRVKCLFSHIQDYSWLKFGVGKQAAGESYGNVKMPGMA